MRTTLVFGCSEYSLLAARGFNPIPSNRRTKGMASGKKLTLGEADSILETFEAKGFTGVTADGKESGPFVTLELSYIGIDGIRGMKTFAIPGEFAMQLTTNLATVCLSLGIEPPPIT